MTMPLLDVAGLIVDFSTRHGAARALDGVDLSLKDGEILGVVGESGSGKSVTALATLGLLDPTARVHGGSIRFRGEELLGAPERVLRRIRGASISMIFQNPRAALNPILPIGQQIADALRAHRELSPSAAKAQALQLLNDVHLREPERLMDAYPHELSGGMCQRVMIAIAIACEPTLLIADEPTTGLDVTTQKVVMDLLAGLVRTRGMAMILITHDLGLAAMYCQRLTVMERGKVVEAGAASDLLDTPRHPYARRLVAATPTPTSRVEDLLPEPPPPLAEPTAQVGGELLHAKDLLKRFGGRAVVENVSFSVGAGESVGLVGESGSGKSTISRLVSRLLDIDGGSIRLADQEIGAVPARRFYREPLRRDIQLVHQDPTDSLNPRFTAAQSIADPMLRLLPKMSTEELNTRIIDVAARVGLEASLLTRLPHQLSGGQKARVGIARAIAVEPRILVLDEPTAALDVSVQAVVLNLLRKLQYESGMAYLFVSHDLNVVRMMCQRMIVLRAGQIVEAGDSLEIFSAPQHPYTRQLIEAIPMPRQPTLRNVTV